MYNIFLKLSKNYQEISSYLELIGSYLATMTVFDEAWELYNHKG